MKTVIALSLFAGLFVGASGQASPASSVAYGTPVRIKIRHADPWAVKAMLEGRQILAPEISTIIGFAGLPALAAQSANTLLRDGILIVNPTDNSLWLYPTKK